MAEGDGDSPTTRSVEWRSDPYLQLTSLFLHSEQKRAVWVVLWHVNP